MKKIKIYSPLFLAILMYFSCSHSENGGLETVDIIRVQMPSQINQTRVGVVTSEGLDLHFSWNTIDLMHFYAQQNLNGLILKDLGESYVTNISEDKQCCEFEIERPASFDKIAPYSVFGITGMPSTFVDGKVWIYTYVRRSTLANFSAPMWFRADIGYSFPNVEAKHIGTYELIHIKNTSNNPIVFKLKDYEAEEKWYYVNAAYIPETGEVINNMAPVETTGQKVEAVIKIEPNADGTLISWYIPNGNKIKDVRIVAEIDGTVVKSANTKSSDVQLQVGHAYHMYATWYGKELRFENEGDDYPDNDDGELDDVPGYEL